ncbi:MAG: RluA family pseudouridine synthase [Pseudorhodobacter sp.]|nr:RluA family pseudouridine synthase [Rhizobacter sp.]
MNSEYRVAALSNEDAASAAPDSSEGEGSEFSLAEASEIRVGVVSNALHGQRIDKTVVSLAPEFSRSHLQTLIEKGHVQLEGRVVQTASRRVSAGQRVSIELIPTPESLAFRAEPMALNVVFEDSHLMVVNKPAGLVVHPAAGHWSGTLLNGLLAHHQAAFALPRAGIVHRLDKDTSGLMVVGKTLIAVTALVRAIAARIVHRQYLAIAHGAIGSKHMEIDAPVGRDPLSRVRMAVHHAGKPARTDVDLILRTLDFSAVRCTLHTGRTHQIRVHMAAQGHPLVGDMVYGGRPALGMQRQALHAARLSFAHPCADGALAFEADAPEDFAAALAQLKG